jgi:hypothetical protein
MIGWLRSAGQSNGNNPEKEVEVLIFRRDAEARLHFNFIANGMTQN